MVNCKSVPAFIIVIGLVVVVVVLHTTLRTRPASLAIAGEYDLESQMTDSTKDPKDLFAEQSMVWLEAECEGRRLLFATQVLPSYGVSRIVIHGWCFNPQTRLWDRVLYSLITGAGSVELLFDSEQCLFRVRGAANNRLNSVDVLSFDVRSTEK